MKTIHLIYLLLLTVSFVSCGDDDDAPAPTPILSDTVAPEVTILVPEASGSLLVIDKLEVLANLTDNTAVDSVRVVLSRPSGDRQILLKSKIRENLRNHDLYVAHKIPKYAATGDYTVMVEAKDYGKNVTKDSVTFTLHASNITSAEFAKPFNNALINSEISEFLGWAGYNAWDDGFSFNTTNFGYLMHLMVNTDREHSISKAEWDKFMADFGAEGQSWAEWDENNDGNLNDAEFYKGLSGLNFFKDWDINQDELVSYDEMAAGIFSRWDSNKDNLLSREEYQDKFYTYLYKD